MQSSVIISIDWRQSIASLWDRQSTFSMAIREAACNSQGSLYLSSSIFPRKSFHTLNSSVDLTSAVSLFSWTDYILMYNLSLPPSAMKKSLTTLLSSLLFCKRIVAHSLAKRTLYCE